MRAHNIMWFRRDLRLKDNHALSKALKSGLPVKCIFIFDPGILKEFKNPHHPLVTFMWYHLQDLQQSLRQHSSDLHFYHAEPVGLLNKMLKEGAKHIFFNEDYEPSATIRDAKVLKTQAATAFKDQVCFGPTEVLKKDKTPYTVFTPYKNKWLEFFDKTLIKTHDLNLQNLMPGKSKNVFNLEKLGFQKFNESLPSKSVPKSILTSYAKQRDLPYLKSTSRLGPHLRMGTVSPRKCIEKALELKSDTWLSELIWREFFMQILFHFPHVEKRSFKAEYDKIQWLNNKKEFKAWCEGKTGYPLVDAGMRELVNTGFMHNRVRMLAASFLTKHLLIDWRWGENFFAQHLMDFELSANNGNWQWAAGCGCDAAPYFRVFNPEIQQKKFDPDFKYIKKWVPEYRTGKYPEPIIEHKTARIRCLRAYKKAL